ncbi:MAG: hypothetical protein KDD82_00605 [Planctomycetes bacterium]|nr:hypothetical protein [Planctomycetota bacterium]
MAVEIKFGDHVKEALEICKANLVPTLATPIVSALPIILIYGVAMGLTMATESGLIMLLALPLIIVASLFQGVVFINWMAAIKAAKHEGKAIEIGSLLDFSNIVSKMLTWLIMGILFNICIIPGVIVCFAPCIVADKPGTSPIDAIKAALSFGKGNIVPLLILMIVLFLVYLVGAIACGIGALFTGPLAIATWYLAYDTHKASVEAAAAEGGVQLS